MPMFSTMKRNNVIAFAFLVLLVSYDFDHKASATFVKIVGVLIKAQNYKIFAQSLIDTGVGDELESTQASGLTLFVPTDAAFNSLPPNVNISIFSKEKKLLLLKYHVLPSYNPAEAQGFISPKPQPTLATKATAPNKFTVIIRNSHGPITIDTGIVKSYVTKLVHNKKPVAIYEISKVLLSPDLGN